MSLFNKSFPNLLSGVSQQADALRTSDACKVQTNAYPSPVEGLTKRNPTDYVWRTAGVAYGAGYKGGTCHVINRDENEKYLVSIKQPDAGAAVFTVFDLESGAYAGVSTPDGVTYLAADNPSTAFKFVTVGDATFILNKEKIAKMDSTLSEPMAEQALVHIRQGDYETDYKVTIDGTTKTITTSETDHTQTQTDYIATTLTTELRGTADSWYQDNAVQLGGILNTDGDGSNDVHWEGSGRGSGGAPAGKWHFIVQESGGDTWADKFTEDKPVRFTSVGTSTSSNFMYNLNATNYGQSYEENRSFQKYVSYYIESADASTKTITLKTSVGASAKTLHAPHGTGTNVDLNKDGSGTAIIQVNQATSSAFPNFTFRDKDSSILCDSTEPFTIEANDSVSDTFIKAFHKKTQYFSELPATSYDDFRLQVSGDAESIVDDYYIKFQTREETQYGEGTWVEAVGPEVKYKYDYSTMPMVLLRQSDGTFILKEVDGNSPAFITWQDQVLAGDTATAITGEANENAAVGPFIDSGQLTTNATHTAGTGTKATGSIRVDSTPDNDDTLVLTDHTGYAYTLKFHATTTSGGFLNGRYVSTAGSPSDETMATRINTAITEANLLFTNTVSTDTVSLVAALDGVAGNQTITQTGGTHHTLVGMSGGLDFYSTVALEGMTAGRVIAAGTLISKNPNTTTSHPTTVLNLTQDGWAGSPRYTWKTYEAATVASDGTVTVKVEGDVVGGSRRTGNWLDNDIVSFYEDADYKKFKWADRRAGDDASNPLPSFIDETIEDIFLYENRLGFIAGSNVCLSESGEYYNFFKVTTNQLLDTATIDVTVPATTVAKLRHGVPFKGNLILFDEETQYVLGAGREAVTPQTVAISQSGTSECDRDCKPAVIGSTIMIPYRRGSNTGFNSMLIENPEADIYNTFDLSDHIPTYLEGNMKQVVSMPQENLVIVLPQPTAGAVNNTLYFYKYLDVNRKRVQSAWFKYEIDLPTSGNGFWQNDGSTVLNAQIDSIHVVESTLYMTVAPNKAATNHFFELIKMEIGSNLTDDNSAVLTLLDSKCSHNGAATTNNTGVLNQVNADWNTSTAGKTTFGLPYYLSSGDNFKVFSKATGSSASISEVSSSLYTIDYNNSGSSNGGSDIVFSTNVLANQYWFGKTYPMTVELANPMFKGATKSGQSSLVTAGRYQVHSADLVFADTNTFSTSVATAGRSTYSYTFTADVNKVGITTQGTTPIDDGDFRVPIHAKSDNYTLTITSTSAYPTKLLSVEFEGQYNSRSRRAGV